MIKHIFPTLLFAGILIISCQSNHKNRVSIDIKLPAEEYDSLSYYFGQEKLTAYGLWGFNREYPDSTGIIYLDLEANEINWFFITFFPNTHKGNAYKMKNRVFLLAQPGKHYTIEFDSSHPLLFKISGDDEKEQNLFNQMSHRQNSDGFSWITNSDSRPATFLLHLEDSIKNSLKPYLDLYKKKEIDKAFYKTIRDNITYSHAAGLMSHLWIRKNLYDKPNRAKLHPSIHPLQISDDDLYYIKSIIFKKYPISKNQAGIYPNLGSLINEYMVHASGENNLLSSFKGKMRSVDLAPLYIDKDLQEFHFASQFGSASMRSGADSLATFLYPEFKKRYPVSPFMPSVIRSIENLTGYYAAFYPGLKNPQNENVEASIIPNAIFSPEIIFIPESERITSFDSLLNLFHGKYVYVDFWASWCPPCRYEFRFADSLHHFLKAQNIEMLYISTDEDEAKWKNVISNYNLTGHHYRVSNSRMRKELERIVHFLPTYMIIDTAGNIVVDDAKEPHTKSLLYDQLLEILK